MLPNLEDGVPLNAGMKTNLSHSRSLRRLNGIKTTNGESVPFPKMFKRLFQRHYEYYIENKIFVKF
jgi:hypothetical protein